MKSLLRSQLNSWITYGLVPAVLCSCSVLGDRQKDARIDIDEASNFNALEIADKSSSTSKNNNTEGGAVSSIALDRRGQYMVRLGNPDLETISHIQTNRVGLKELAKDKKIDPGSVIFDLGAYLFGDAEITPVTEQNTNEIPGYKKDLVDKAVEDLECKSTPSSFLVKGNTEIRLDDAQIGLILQHTSSEDLQDADREDLFDKDFRDGDVTGGTFGDLNDFARGEFEKDFNPEFGTFDIGITQHVLYCAEDTNGKPRAFVFNSGEYHFINADAIEVSGDETKLKFSIVVPKDFLTELTLISREPSGTDAKTFADLQFSDENVFRIGQYRLYEELTIQQAVFGSGSSDDGAVTTSGYTRRMNVGAAARSAIGSADLGEGGGAYAPEPISTLAYVAPDSTEPTMSDEELRDAIAASEMHELPIQTDLPITPNWFDPHFDKKYVRNLYRDDGTYGGDNQDSMYAKKPYLKDDRLLETSQVREICNTHYKRKSKITFDVRFDPPVEDPKDESYLELANGENRTYEDVLRDQFRTVGTGDKQVPINFIRSIIKPNKDMRRQTWKLKFCYDLRDPSSEHPSFLAFLHTNELAQAERALKNVGSKQKQIDRLPMEDKDKWIQNAFVESFAAGFDPANLPRGYNSNRKYAPSRGLRSGKKHSSLEIVCDVARSQVCYGVFNLAFRDEAIPSVLIASVNPLVMGPSNFKRNAIFNILVGNRYPETGEKKVIRSEFYMTGSFEIPDLRNMGTFDTVAKFFDPRYLKEKGIVRDVIEPPMTRLLPGNLSAMRYKIFPINGATN